MFRFLSFPPPPNTHTHVRTTHMHSHTQPIFTFIMVTEVMCEIFSYVNERNLMLHGKSLVLVLYWQHHRQSIMQRFTIWYEPIKSFYPCSMCIILKSNILKLQWISLPLGRIFGNWGWRLHVHDNQTRYLFWISVHEYLT